MKDVIARVDDWLAAGEGVALATVVAVRRSAPRPPGAKMAMSASGGVEGMVSGGCVEGAVVTESLEILGEGGAAKPRRVTYGYSDDEAFAVGLTCGGTVHLLIEPLDW